MFLFSAFDGNWWKWLQKKRKKNQLIRKPFNTLINSLNLTLDRHDLRQLIRGQLHLYSINSIAMPKWKDDWAPSKDNWSPSWWAFSSFKTLWDPGFRLHLFAAIVARWCKDPPDKLFLISLKLLLANLLIFYNSFWPITTYAIFPCNCEEL